MSDVLCKITYPRSIYYVQFTLYVNVHNTLDALHEHTFGTYDLIIILRCSATDNGQIKADWFLRPILNDRNALFVNSAKR